MTEIFVEMQTLSVFALGTALGFSLSFLLQQLKCKSIKYDVNTCRNNKLLNESAEESIFALPSNVGTMCRMIIGVRNDLKMSKGKVAAQVAHAAVAAYVKTAKKAPELLKSWTKYGQAKIAVRLEGEEQMLELAQRALSLGIIVSIIRDAGHTQVEPDTRTVVAFGPAPKELLDRVTGHLKLY